ncbi:MAG: DUF3298 domain-containing protein [Lachnospiraceae bacterium]|nr:DUF3298 domain-containing protein [Lachnospiraceae bacterium]
MRKRSVAALLAFACIVTFGLAGCGGSQSADSGTQMETAESADAEDAGAESNASSDDSSEAESAVDWDAVQASLKEQFEAEAVESYGFEESAFEAEQVETVLDSLAYRTFRYSVDWTGADGFTFVRYYTVDTVSQDVVDLMSLPGMDQDVAMLVSSNVKEQMQERSAEDDTVTFWQESDAPDDAFDSVDADTQYYIKDDNTLVIYFLEGEYGPTATGDAEFEIPQDIFSVDVNGGV